MQFFYQRVLDRDWQWVEMIRAPKIRSLPDILSVAEIERLIGADQISMLTGFMLFSVSESALVSGAPLAPGGDHKPIMRMICNKKRFRGNVFARPRQIGEPIVERPGFA